MTEPVKEFDAEAEELVDRWMDLETDEYVSFSARRPLYKMVAQALQRAYDLGVASEKENLRDGCRLLAANWDLIGMDENHAKQVACLFGANEFIDEAWDERARKEKPDGL